MKLNRFILIYIVIGLFISGCASIDKNGQQSSDRESVAELDSTKEAQPESSEESGKAENEQNSKTENEQSSEADKENSSEQGSDNPLDSGNVEDVDPVSQNPSDQEDIDFSLVQPNEIGDIIIAMYHGIQNNPPYHRTAEDYKKDLQYMYDNGYRLISMRDYIDHNISVAAGYTPIVLTFDDGLRSSFSLEEVNGELRPVEDSAVGILEAFNAEHPDFE